MSLQNKPWGVKDFFVWTFYFKRPYEDLSRELAKYKERVKKAEAREEGGSDFEEEDDSKAATKNTKIALASMV